MLTIDECKRMLSNAARERRELKGMVDKRDELIRDMAPLLMGRCGAVCEYAKCRSCVLIDPDTCEAKRLVNRVIELRFGLN